MILLIPFVLFIWALVAGILVEWNPGGGSGDDSMLGFYILWPIVFVLVIVTTPIWLGAWLGYSLYYATKKKKL